MGGMGTRGWGGFAGKSKGIRGGGGGGGGGLGPKRVLSSLLVGFNFITLFFFSVFFCGGRIPKLYIYKTKIFE